MSIASRRVCARSNAEIKIAVFEAGTLTQYLTYGLQAAGFEVVCLEARQVIAALAAMRNKSVSPLPLHPRPTLRGLPPTPPLLDRHPPSLGASALPESDRPGSFPPPVPATCGDPNQIELHHKG